MDYRRNEFDVSNRINTTDPVCVKLEVGRIHRDLYPQAPAPAFLQAFDDVAALYRGERAAYDKFGANWKEGQEFKPPPNWDAGFEFSGGFTGADQQGFSDFFETLFGGAGFGTRGAGRALPCIHRIAAPFRGAAPADGRGAVRAPAREHGQATGFC